MDKHPRSKDDLSDSEDEGELAPNTDCRKVSNEDETQFFFVESLPFALQGIRSAQEEEEHVADIKMVEKVKRQAAIEEQK